MDISIGQTRISTVKPEPKDGQKAMKNRVKKGNICAVNIPSTFETGATALACLVRRGRGWVILCGIQLLSGGLFKGDFDAVHQ